MGDILKDIESGNVSVFDRVDNIEKLAANNARIVAAIVGLCESTNTQLENIDNKLNKLVVIGECIKNIILAQAIILTTIFFAVCLK